MGLDWRWNSCGQWRRGHSVRRDLAAEDRRGRGRGRAARELSKPLRVAAGGAWTVQRGAVRGDGLGRGGRRGRGRFIGFEVYGDECAAGRHGVRPQWRWVQDHGTDSVDYFAALVLA